MGGRYSRPHQQRMRAWPSRRSLDLARGGRDRSPPLPLLLLLLPLPLPPSPPPPSFLFFWPSHATHCPMAHPRWTTSGGERVGGGRALGRRVLADRRALGRCVLGGGRRAAGRGAARRRAAWAAGGRPSLPLVTMCTPLHAGSHGPPTASNHRPIMHKTGPHFGSCTHPCMSAHILVQFLVLLCAWRLASWHPICASKFGTHPPQLVNLLRPGIESNPRTAPLHSPFLLLALPLPPPIPPACPPPCPWAPGSNGHGLWVPAPPAPPGGEGPAAAGGGARARGGRNRGAARKPHRRTRTHTVSGSAPATPVVVVRRPSATCAGGRGGRGEEGGRGGRERREGEEEGTLRVL